MVASYLLKAGDALEIAENKAQAMGQHPVRSAAEGPFVFRSWYLDSLQWAPRWLACTPRTTSSWQKPFFLRSRRNAPFSSRLMASITTSAITWEAIDSALPNVPMVGTLAGSVAGTLPSHFTENASRLVLNSAFNAATPNSQAPAGYGPRMYSQAIPQRAVPQTYPLEVSRSVDELAKPVLIVIIAAR